MKVPGFWGAKERTLSGLPMAPDPPSRADRGKMDEPDISRLGSKDPEA